MICGLARLIEYFVIKTDETIVAENFLHKTFGIAVLAIALHSRGDTWKSIGFIKDRAVSDILKVSYWEVAASLWLIPLNA